jgi:hypothetical protein
LIYADDKNPQWSFYADVTDETENSGNWRGGFYSAMLLLKNLEKNGPYWSDWYFDNDSSVVDHQMENF